MPTREEVNDDHFDGRAELRLGDREGARNRPFDAISPGGQKIAFVSVGAQPSNPEGDDEIYKMDANGSDRENLTDNSGINDVTPDFGKVAKG